MFVGDLINQVQDHKKSGDHYSWVQVFVVIFWLHGFEGLVLVIVFGAVVLLFFWRSGFWPIALALFVGLFVLPVFIQYVDEGRHYSGKQ